MKRNHILFGLLSVLVIVGVPAIALFVGGLQASGTIQATSGSQPSSQVFNIDANLTDSNNTQILVYDNSDGDLDMEFSCLQNITSTVGNCNVETDKDLKVWINSKPCESTPVVSIVPGNNNIEVVMENHPNRCPYNGTITITGTIV